MKVMAPKGQQTQKAFLRKPIAFIDAAESKWLRELNERSIFKEIFAIVLLAPT